MKRYFLIALLTVLTATIGHAANEVIVDGVIYEWYENSVTHEYGYTATGWDEVTPIQSLHIRGEVDGYQVYGIKSSAFVDNTSIVYLTVDEGITTIGQNAFSRCANLKVAILPEGLETIEEEAFAFCTSLTEFVVPSTVRDIQARAFMGCTGVTEVYFLMTDAAALDEFVWWDGWYQNIFDDYASPDLHGGIEFNRSRLPDAVIENPSQPGETVTIEHNPEGGTMIHVPFGTRESYVASTKLEAWLLEKEAENECHPLWWIVNYGVIGRDYTISDDIVGIYVDVEDGLYAKDFGNWLTPDIIYPGEIDFMKGSHLMDTHGDYDQSNWVVLRNLESPSYFKGYVINGGTLTGTLLNKKNPEILVTSTPERGQLSQYEPNIYIPASFMGRTQVGGDNNTYAFVQPKPQELIHVDWAVYSIDYESFYLPKPTDEINEMALKGGFKACYDLLPAEYSEDDLVDCQAYSFDAINRCITVSEDALMSSTRLKDDEYEPSPYFDGGVSDTFIVYPIEIPDEPIPTAITEIETSSKAAYWYTIDGRCLGTTKPTVPGIYINRNSKIVVR